LVPRYHFESAPDRTPLPVGNCDYNSSEPRAEADTRVGNSHICDIHFAISASSFSEKKSPSKGPEPIWVDESCQLSAVERTFAVLLERESSGREARFVRASSFWNISTRMKLAGPASEEAPRHSRWCGQASSRLVPP